MERGIGDGVGKGQAPALLVMMLILPAKMPAAVLHMLGLHAAASKVCGQRHLSMKHLAMYLTEI